MNIAKKKNDQREFPLSPVRFFVRSTSPVREKQFSNGGGGAGRNRATFVRVQTRRRTKRQAYLVRLDGKTKRLPAAEHFALIFRFANETTRLNGPRIVDSFTFSFFLLHRGNNSSGRVYTPWTQPPFARTFRLFSRLNHGEIG